MVLCNDVISFHLLKNELKYDSDVTTDTIGQCMVHRPCIKLGAKVPHFLSSDITARMVVLYHQRKTDNII